VNCDVQVAMMLSGMGFQSPDVFAQVITRVQINYLDSSIFLISRSLKSALCAFLEVLEDETGVEILLSCCWGFL
jgi:hypothetical protein